MNNNFRRIGTRGLAVIGFALVLGSQACEEKKMVEQAPGKALESAVPAPAAERSVAERRESSPSGDSAVDASREATPAGSAK